jgi:hypothetical protein
LKGYIEWKEGGTKAKGRDKGKREGQRQKGGTKAKGRDKGKKVACGFWDVV